MSSANTRFDPIELAITLPKGFAHEFKGRSWFDQIYFSKLSMINEAEGYMPVLYQFVFSEPTPAMPDQMLMTFFYPDQKRISNLNGIVILGGQPDIYKAYQSTIELTPQLESLVIAKHEIDETYITRSIEHLLQQISEPQRLKSITSILEQSLGKKKEALPSFFPILQDTTYVASELALPLDFGIDAVFTFTVSPQFFKAEQPGDGFQTIRLFRHKRAQSAVRPRLAFPLIVKWQPIYNDILKQLLQTKSVFDEGYGGHLLPRIVIFKNQKTGQYSALISSIIQFDDVLYYNVALANSGRPEGQPLSLLDKQLRREKFGQGSWISRVVKKSNVDNNGYMDSVFAEDLISTELEEILSETTLLSDGVFDLGRLRAIHEEELQ